ncbi:TauD/TfdA family dioxygenase [Halobacteriovorax sp. ZH4_bin.1]|uniref:TauD/TfdA family dioxygenase n=1 Tax=unclassified Halobacteriovorax TaxID=2639665 RepID=UPI003719941A
MIELNAIEYNLNDLKMKIITLGKEDHHDCLIIRNALNKYNIDEWSQFLTNICKLSRDTRHYQIDSTLVSADWWEISYDPLNSHTYAHSNTSQPFHTDNAWFQNPSPINFFIMKKQAITGGEQFIIPLDDLIDNLKLNNPELLNKLTSINVDIQKGTTDYKYRGPIINLEKKLIHWNYYRTNKENKTINNMCDEFFNYLKSSHVLDIIQTIKLNTGDALCLADVKLLHARNSYEANNKGDRVLLQSMWKLNAN